MPTKPEVNGSVFFSEVLPENVDLSLSDDEDTLGSALFQSIGMRMTWRVKEILERNPDLVSFLQYYSFINYNHKIKELEILPSCTKGPHPTKRSVGCIILVKARTIFG